MNGRMLVLIPLLAALAACGGDGAEVREEGAGFGEADPADSVVVGPSDQGVPGAEQPGPQDAP